MEESKASRIHRLMSEAFDLMTEIEAGCSDPDKRGRMEAHHKQILTHAIMFLANTDGQFLAAVSDYLKIETAI